MSNYRDLTYDHASAVSDGADHGFPRIVLGGLCYLCGEFNLSTLVHRHGRGTWARGEYFALCYNRAFGSHRLQIIHDASRSSGHLVGQSEIIWDTSSLGIWYAP